MKRTVYFFWLMMMWITVSAQTQKIQNQPYADHKLYHFGFHVGLHTQDLILTNRGTVSESDGIWFAEIPEYSPGFSVGVIGDLFLNPYMNLRLSPSIHFGDKTVYFKEQGTGEIKRVSVRSNYLSAPLDVKIQSARLNNMRPYITCGVYGDLDLGRKRGTELLMRSLDYGFEFGLGCTFYMPFFRLAPELKFRFGLMDALVHDRDDLAGESDKVYTNSLSKATTRMIVLTFNFE